MKGTTKPRKCAQRCQDHLFSFKPIRSEAHMRQQISLPFCPKPSPNGGPMENTYPEFNRDGKAHSQAFVLGVDRRENIENDHDMFEEHMRKIQEYTDCRRQIFYPKPSRKHKVCSVCRSNYEDYLEHIQSTSHKRQINANKFNNEILAMCAAMKKHNQSQVAHIVVDDDSLKGDREKTLEEYEPTPVKRNKFQTLGWPCGVAPVTSPNVMKGYDCYPSMVPWWSQYEQPLINQYFQQQPFPFMCGSSVMPSPYIPMTYPTHTYPTATTTYQQHYYPLGGASNPIVLDQ